MKQLFHFFGHFNIYLSCMRHCMFTLSGAPSITSDIWYPFRYLTSVRFISWEVRGLFTTAMDI